MASLVCNIVCEECKDRIINEAKRMAQEKLGYKDDDEVPVPGSKWYIAEYQAALTTVVEALDDEECAQLEAQALEHHVHGLSDAQKAK